MKSMTVVNRAQLTPLKYDMKDKPREIQFDQIAERKNGKNQKLNPISGMDSLKHF